MPVVRVHACRVNRLLSGLVVAICLLVAIGILSYPRLQALTAPSPAPQPHREEAASQVVAPVLPAPDRDPTLQAFFSINQPLAVAAPTFRLWDAREWALSGSPGWTEPLGEQLCIVDLDSRPFDTDGAIFGPRNMSWDAPVHGISLGFLNHWVYAKIHKYKYYYVRVDEYPDRRDSWKKAPVLSRLLEDHRICLFLDSDATFVNLALPFEWLLNYWQFGPGSQSVALAYDPVAPSNEDRFGKTYLNTGFIIAQALPRTHEILSAWETCPDRDPGCAEFRTNAPGRPTDQGGFGTFIRYAFDRETDIMSLPCTEANGYTESGSGCDGTFVSHWWTGKSSWIKEGMGRQMPGRVLPLLHHEFTLERPGFFVNETDLIPKKPETSGTSGSSVASGTSGSETPVAAGTTGTPETQAGAGAAVQAGAELAEPTRV